MTELSLFFSSFKDICREFPEVMGIFIGVFGACVGSFLNVCICRIPKGESIIRPSSRCESCGSGISWYDNIPLISWFLLKGRCRRCGVKFGFRYIFIEGLTAVLFLFCWQAFSGLMVFSGFIFVSLMMVVAFIDLDHLIIPDGLSMGGMVSGLVLSFFIPEMHGFENGEPFILNGMRSMGVGFVGAIIGSGFLLWFGLLMEAVLKKEAIGFGDVKLMGCIGAFFGWQGAIFSLFFGALIGLFAVGILLIGTRIGLINGSLLFKGDEQEEDTQRATTAGISLGTRLPFGPWIACAGVVYGLWLCGDMVVYFKLLGDFY